MSAYDNCNSETDRETIPSSVTSPKAVTMTEEQRLARMADAYKTIMECVGEDTSREGVESTPMRAAKAMMYMSKGYDETPEGVIGEGVFAVDTQSDMVMVRNIEIYSMCEHHMVPFFGKVSIAYVPNGKILGLSKLARIADVYARRFQVQERLTRQIAEAIMEAVQPLGVAVVCECSHMCMVMRGVEKSGSSTTTNTFLGCFKSDKEVRTEFFHMLNK